MKPIVKCWCGVSKPTDGQPKGARTLAMKRVSPLMAAIVISLGVLICSTQAQTAWNSGAVNNADRNTITPAGSFTWSTPGAWDANGVANGAGLSVSLEPRLTVDSTVTVDNIYTAGMVTARSANKLIKFTGSGKIVFDNGSNPSVFNVNSYVTRFTNLRGDIDVDLQLQSALDIRFGVARQEEATVGRIGKTISGSGALTLTLGNSDATATRLFKLGPNGANTYQGGTSIRHISQIPYGATHNVQNIVQLNAVSTGAFGSGDVTIDGAGCTTTCYLTGVATGRGMWVRLSATDAIVSGATLNLVTATRIALELVSGTTQTLAAVNVDGSPVANGTYTGGSFNWLYGTGTLVVGSGGTPEPEIVVLGSNASTEIASGSAIISTPLGTDFGDVMAADGAPVSHTFTITNTGLATLTLPSAPVTVLGGHSADFTVTQPASLSIEQNTAATFSISFDPSAVGVRTGLVSIANNDGNENPYTFKIQGTGTEPLPVISILSSNRTLVVTNGTTVISEPLGTDIGEILWTGALSAERTFVVTNKGTASLTLTLPITVSGVDSADFTVTQPAAASLEPGQSVSFKIACDPSALGVRTGLVAIANNDVLRTPYTFKVQAKGIPAQISFQQGDGGSYSSTAFTQIEERNPNANYGSATQAQLEEEYRDSSHLLYQGLIAFPDIIGKSDGQIAPESTVSSATLILTVPDDGNATIPVTFHRMLKPWVENEATWTKLTSSTLFGNSATNPLDNAAALLADPSDPIDDGGGEPGVDYVEASAVSKVLYPAGKIEIDVTAVVQAWANGTPNYGLFLQYLDVNGIKIESDDAATLSDRPRLVVSHTPPPPKGTMISFK